jgi:hypothetical protein
MAPMYRFEGCSFHMPIKLREHGMRDLNSSFQLLAHQGKHSHEVTASVGASCITAKFFVVTLLFLTYS